MCPVCSSTVAWMFHTVSSHVSRCKPGNRGMLPDPGVYSTRLVHPGGKKITIKNFHFSTKVLKEVSQNKKNEPTHANNIRKSEAVVNLVINTMSWLIDWPPLNNYLQHPTKPGLYKQAKVIHLGSSPCTFELTTNSLSDYLSPSSGALSNGNKKHGYLPIQPGLQDGLTVMTTWASAWARFFPQSKAVTQKVWTRWCFESKGSVFLMLPRTPRQREIW